MKNNYSFTRNNMTDNNVENNNYIFKYISLYEKSINKLIKIRTIKYGKILLSWNGIFLWVCKRNN